MRADLLALAVAHIDSAIIAVTDEKPAATETSKAKDQEPWPTKPKPRTRRSRRKG